MGESETLGMRHGYVTNGSLVASSIENAVRIAEKTSNIRIKRAFISLSGTTLRSEFGTGGTIVSKADGEVTNLDINKALQDCEDNLNLDNKKIIHMYPISYRLDGKEVLGRLEGMRGTKLEARALFVTYSKVHLEDLLSAVAEAGIETIDVVASPVAISTIALSEKQKILGVALVDIGDQRTSLSVFENELLVSTYTFSIGSGDITNDIALGFKIPLEKAEELKLGSDSWEGISPPKADQPRAEKKKLDEIIEARLCDIFESVENNLKKIKRSELLPAGIVFVGGGSDIPGLIELSKTTLKLPSIIGNTEMFGNVKTKLRDPAWYTVLGLLNSKKDSTNYSDSSLDNFFKDLKNAIKSTIKQLMP